jgi:GNAT superfamily N-acetyltransferase
MSLACQAVALAKVGHFFVINLTQKFQVRLLKTEEVDAAVDLLGRQLREHGVKTDLGKIRSVIERIVKDDRLGFVLVALEKNQRPVGVALGCAFLGVEHGGMSGWLEELYVLPEFRQRGIGSLLIAEFIRVASALGWRAIDLEITGHQRAASLYERHGFTQLDRSRLSRTLGESG